MYWLRPAICFEWIDDIFIDLKHTDDTIHRKLTGVSNQTIIDNIIGLDRMGRKLTVRIPLIEAVTSHPENIEGIIGICGGLGNLIEVELLPYHNLGAGKYAGLGISCDPAMAAPEGETIESILDRMRARGLAARCPGFL